MSDKPFREIIAEIIYGKPIPETDDFFYEYCHELADEIIAEFEKILDGMKPITEHGRNYYKGYKACSDEIKEKMRK